MPYSNLDVSEMFVDRQSQRSSMHARHLNEQLVRVLKTIGYDVGFQKGQGQYLYDRDGVRYLDLLSGFGVFAIGRNHPALRQALKSVLDSDLPNLVQLDVSTLAGVLAGKRAAPTSAGTFNTYSPIFVILLIGTIVIVGALTFLPADALGPIVEHLLMLQGKTF